jgi:hypothetical protein
MEPIKLTTIGHYENQVLTIYNSIIDGEIAGVIANLDFSCDSNYVPFVIQVTISAGGNAKNWFTNSRGGDWGSLPFRVVNNSVERSHPMELGIPFLKNMSGVGEVQDVGRAIRKFCAEQTDPVRDCGRLWLNRY